MRFARIEVGQKFEDHQITSARLARFGRDRRKDLVRFNVIEELAAGLPNFRSLTLYLALIKFERFEEWAVEKATELGVTRIVPVEANQQPASTGLFAGSTTKRAERWKRIARESERDNRARIARARILAIPIRLPEKH